MWFSQVLFSRDVHMDFFSHKEIVETTSMKTTLKKKLLLVSMPSCSNTKNREIVNDHHQPCYITIKDLIMPCDRQITNKVVLKNKIKTID